MNRYERWHRTRKAFAISQVIWCWADEVVRSDPGLCDALVALEQVDRVRFADEAQQRAPSEETWAEVVGMVRHQQEVWLGTRGETREVAVAGR